MTREANIFMFKSVCCIVSKGVLFETLSPVEVAVHRHTVYYLLKLHDRQPFISRRGLSTTYVSAQVCFLTQTTTQTVYGVIQWAITIPHTPQLCDSRQAVYAGRLYIYPCVGTCTSPGRDTR